VSTAETDGLPQPRRARAALCILGALAASVLDASMLNVALPTMAREFGVSPAEAVWVVNAYQITVVGALIPFAALGEILGFRRVWAAGLALFCGAALLAALAPGFEALVAARVLQGLGSAAAMSLLAGLVRHTYPAKDLGRAIGNTALTVAVCSALGPSLGAAVIALASWPFVFLLHLPLALAALAFGLRSLPEPQPQPRAFDLGAAALNMAAFGLVFVGLDLVLHHTLPGVLALAAGVACAVALVRHQLGRTPPLLPLDLLAIRTVRLAIAASVCMFGAHMLTIIPLPFHLQAAGYTPFEIGLIITPYPLAVGLLAPIAGRLSDRVPSALPCALGGVVLAVALVAIALLPPERVEWLCAALLLAGVGFGFFQAPNNRTILAGTPRARAGSAGGMQATARVLGQAFGATVAALCFTLLGPSAAFLCGAVLAVAAGALSLARR
jgi:DHA2 family multidrug resistance protein-like MFS transporter